MGIESTRWFQSGLALALSLAVIGCEEEQTPEAAGTEQASKLAEQTKKEAEKAMAKAKKAAEEMDKAAGGEKAKGHDITKEQIKNKRMELAKAAESETKLTIKQEAGKVVYWVAPGPRRLEKAVFGKPDKPKRTAEVPEGAPQKVKDLIKKVPILIGVPEKMRVMQEGKYQTKMPTPFSDKGMPISGDDNGSMEITFIDRQEEDGDEHPMITADEVEATIEFKDPKGNTYELKPKMTVKPPMPGYETEGGVMLQAHHHGDTGTGSPLMPKVYTHGAFWALGDVVVNGETVNKMQLIHCMMTQTVRDKDYKLVFTKELPLDKEDTIAQQDHHTHCVALPVKGEPTGPVYEPVKTAYEPKKGEKQPFIHVMFEKDEVVEGPEFELPTNE